MPKTTWNGTIAYDPSGSYRPEGSHVPVRSNAPASTDESGKTKWASNPFWGAFELSTRRKKETINEDGLVVVNTSTGDRTGTAEVSRIFEVDKDRFVKVFADHLKVFFDLSPTGIKLLQVIMHEMGQDPNNDYVYLSASSVVDHLKKTGKKYSPASYYRARDELLAKGFIAESVRIHIYWINPALFWNGDRVKFITELRPAPEILPPAKSTDSANHEAVDLVADILAD